MVEDVEGFAENLGAVAVAEANFLGETQVHIDGALHHKSVAADEVDALAAIGTVDARTERLGADCGDVTRDRIGARAESKTWRRAGGDQGVGQTALGSVNRGELPVIGKVTERPTHFPWAFGDGGKHKAVRHVKDGVA